MMSTYPYPTQKRKNSVLESLLLKDHSLKLTRPFKGMLFTQELSFVAMEMDRAVFSIARGRLLADPGDRIFLCNLSGTEVFSARVSELDNFRGKLSLVELKTLGRPWAARSHERVQPHQPTRAALRSKQCAMSTFLQNISLAGIGLLAYKPLERGLELRIGHPVKVDLELPVAHGRLSLPGKLVNVSYPGACLAYIGVETYPNVQQASLLERYITNRKGEIIDEIDREIKESFSPPGVRDMYF